MPTPVLAAVLAPLVLWRVVSRIKRLTTRQRSKTWRHRTTLVFFPLLLVILTVVSIKTNPIALAGMAAGLPVGAILGRIAIGKTRFEQVGTDFFFTPHAQIGLVVAMLFMGRMAWRAYELYTLGSFEHHEFVSSPLTLVIFGVLAGYYMSFAFGLLSWRKRTAPAVTNL